MPTAYDEIAPDYLAFVDGALEERGHILNAAAETLREVIGAVASQSVCDLGCGEGHFSRRLAREGARVVGVDTSEHLLEAAARRSDGLPIRYVLDDAQTLGTLRDGEFELVVSNFALMDIPSLEAVYAAVFRVLRPGGRFVFSLTHPSFQLPRHEAGEDYFREGFWRSTWKGGIRGRVGAHHRTLSTYVNGLLHAGFGLTGLTEPRPLELDVPKVLVVACLRP